MDLLQYLESTVPGFIFLVPAAAFYFGYLYLKFRYKDRKHPNIRGYLEPDEKVVWEEIRTETLPGEDTPKGYMWATVGCVLGAIFFALFGRQIAWPSTDPLGGYILSGSAGLFGGIMYSMYITLKEHGYRAGCIVTDRRVLKMATDEGVRIVPLKRITSPVVQIYEGKSVLFEFERPFKGKIEDGTAKWSDQMGDSPELLDKAAQLLGPQMSVSMGIAKRLNKGAPYELTAKDLEGAARAIQKEARKFGIELEVENKGREGPKRPRGRRS